jgi:hypothetical protein
MFVSKPNKTQVKSRISITPEKSFSSIAANFAEPIKTGGGKYWKFPRRVAKPDLKDARSMG